MTATSFTAIPNAVRAKEGGLDAGLGVSFLQMGVYGDTDVTIAVNEGWDTMGCIEGAIDYNSQVENYIAAGGVPETDLGVRKTSHKKAFTITLSYPEDFAIALAHGQLAPTVTYTGTNTLVDTGSGSISSTTIPVTAASGANYSVGDWLEIIVGNATYGTRAIYRYIKSITTDLITIDRPLDRLPANGAAVKEVSYLEYVESTDELTDPVQLRIVENDNGREKFHIVHILKAQFGVGKYIKGDGKVPVTVELSVTALGEYDSTNDRYNILKRRTYG